MTSVQWRRKTASAFIESSTTSSTMMPVAASSWKPACGRLVELKIWIGITVNGSRMSSGRNAAKVSAPIMISGAVSPIARESARIMPVRMPGMTCGRTWCQTICQRVAPRP